MDSLLYVFDGMVIKDLGYITGKHSIDFQSFYPLILFFLEEIVAGVSIARLFIELDLESKKNNKYHVKFTEQGTEKKITVKYARNWPEFMNQKGRTFTAAISECKPVAGIPMVGKMNFNTFINKITVKDTISKLLPLAGVPSKDLYPKATKELWIIGTNFSETLRTIDVKPNGDLKEPVDSAYFRICQALEANQGLTVHLAVADPNPQQRLQAIAETEIKALYGINTQNSQLSAEDIQRSLVQNRFNRSINKFLWPPELDYIEKVNDMYAALFYLYLKAGNNAKRIKCHYYQGPPTLRSTIIYGNEPYIDFLHVYGGHIGMTGTLHRLEGDNGAKNEVWNWVEKERKSTMQCGEAMPLRETLEDVARILNVEMDPEIKKYACIDKGYYEVNRHKNHNLVNKWDVIDRKMKSFCVTVGYGITKEDKQFNRQIRRRFLTDITSAINNVPSGKFIKPIAIQNA